MMRDALGEFVVRDAGGGDIGDGPSACGGEPFGVRALARARAAENEGEVARNHRVIVTGRAIMRPSPFAARRASRDLRAARRAR